MTTQKEIIFEKNWNNKLDCCSFCTIRLMNNSEYSLLDDYEIIFKPKGKETGISKGLARLQSINNFYIDQITPAMAYLDCNLSKFDCIKMIKVMYSKSPVNWKEQKLSFLVLQYVSIKNIMDGSLNNLPNNVNFVANDKI